MHHEKKWELALRGFWSLILNSQGGVCLGFLLEALLVPNTQREREPARVHTRGIQVHWLLFHAGSTSACSLGVGLWFIV